MPRAQTETFDGLVVGYGRHTVDNDIAAVTQSANGIVTVTQELILSTLRMPHHFVARHAVFLTQMRPSAARACCCGTRCASTRNRLAAPSFAAFTHCRACHFALSVARAPTAPSSPIPHDFVVRNAA